jgi:NAD(P)-dependent dehydrogenase (short-subunit alcohol dehydrogenase family)
MKVLTIGGSRNIGYYSSVRLLSAFPFPSFSFTCPHVFWVEKGATVTFLLRNTAVFDQDKVIQEYVKSGKANLVKGDALVKDDCKKAWEEAEKAEHKGGVDILLFTVGMLKTPFLLSKRTTVFMELKTTRLLWTT